MQLLTKTSKTLTSPSPHASSLPTLPIDLVGEILFKLPLELLLQFRCVCKSFNSLISDRKFAKKHLCLSTMRHNLIVFRNDNIRQFPLFVSTIPSFFTTSSITHSYYDTIGGTYGFPLKTCSCDGILCLTTNYSTIILWNPTINKFKRLPHLKYVRRRRIEFPLASFGYDPFVDNYKVFAVYFCENENQVSVHTLGTDSWRRIQNNFPNCSTIHDSGIFVGRTVNWLAIDAANLHEIVSLDLKNESYQTLLQPDLGTDSWTLGVVRDCLSIFANTKMCFDVWIMKEYGMKESWTKLFSIPYMKNGGLYNKVLHISEDDQLLMYSHVLGDVNLNLVVYDSKNDALKIIEFGNINPCEDPEVYVESLLSPCS